MCTCESGMKKKRTTPLNLSVSVLTSLETQQQQRSRKRPRHSRCVRFAASKSEEQERQQQPHSLLPNEDAVQTSPGRECSCLSLASILPAPLPAAETASLQQPLHPFVPANQWLQPWEQQLQRHEVLQELQQLSVDPEAEHFRDLYQSIYQVCHALADATATATTKNSHNNNETVLPKELVVICTQLLSSNNSSVNTCSSAAAVSDDTTTTRRGLEDGLVPLVALARRLERRQTIRTVLALQKQPKVAAAVGRHLSRAHGTFAHALALGDAAAAQLIYNCDDNDNC